MDFGFSIELKDPEDTLELKKRFGSHYYRAPEIIDPSKMPTASLKSDIYSLVPVIAYLLGASDPCAKKHMYTEFTPYSYSDILNFTEHTPALKASAIFLSATLCILKFLDRMQDIIPQNRPDMDEVLHFFFQLRKLSYLDDKPHNTPSKNAILAKLVLMANGHWQQTIGTKEISVIPTRAETPSKTKETINRTFKDIDFEHEDNRKLCATLAKYTHNSLPLQEALNVIPKPPKKTSKWWYIGTTLAVIAGIAAIATGIGAIVGIPLALSIGSTLGLNAVASGSVLTTLGAIFVGGSLGYAQYKSRTYSQKLLEYKAATPSAIMRPQPTISAPKRSVLPSLSPSKQPYIEIKKATSSSQHLSTPYVTLSPSAFYSSPKSASPTSTRIVEIASYKR